jgi:hypothetical protein
MAAIAAALVAALVFGLWYVLMHLDPSQQEYANITDMHRILAFAAASAMMMGGALLWPRSRVDLPWTDYLFPASTFYLGSLCIAFVFYHCRVYERYMCDRGHECSRAARLIGRASAGELALGLLYLVYRSWPPPPPEAADARPVTLLTDLLRLARRLWGA